MRYKLEVPLTSRLANGQWFRRFRATESRGGKRSAAFNDANAVYGATPRRDAWTRSGDAC